MSDDNERLSTRVTITYGDYHYRVEMNNFGAFTNRQADEAAVRSFIYKGLSEFHKRDNDTIHEVAKLKSNLWDLASDRPDLITELVQRGLI
jgi:hypothetical protein